MERQDLTTLVTAVLAAKLASGEIPPDVRQPERRRVSATTSIHPRVVGGRTVHAKVNTSAPRSKARILRAIAGMERHLENNPHDTACQQRIANARTRAA